jgi:hypothetical protein
MSGGGGWLIDVVAAGRGNRALSVIAKAAPRKRRRR